MKKLILIFLGLILIISLTLADSNIWATNGAQMIGVGPVSRAMGGTGIANPQDGVSAIYLNPAGMIYYNKLKVDFGATLFKPSIDSAMTAGPTPT
ncbi:MAG: outer membrane protein transport protein, partial [Spirochaetota bacterium]|nr:outer membrane protein transport protein [Spirochaetota bacterium]